MNTITLSNRDKKDVCTENTATLRDKLLAAMRYRRDNIVTKQRIAVIDAICAMPNFEYVEDLWLWAREHHAISRASVYNVVRILVDHGLVRKEKQNYGYTYHLIVQE